MRKVLERQVKSLTHDRAAISVAPPRLYSRRFLEFTTSRVFAGGAGAPGAPEAAAAAAATGWCLQRRRAPAAMQTCQARRLQAPAAPAA